ncbi:glucosyl transferase [Candidatus Pantoea formicae]|uniref:glucosyl transferase n=1 Tax=Candidatus Pantoea formicae TaxID=2608355 RepID=UPI003EDA738D
MVKDKFSLNAASIVGSMALAFLLLVLRRPDIVTHAQPWAEDGRVWMAGIYNNGFWSSLFLPQNGYFQTISRITYGIALWFGLSHAALVANILAILIRCFFVGLVLSGRMNFIGIWYRIAFVIYFILMPNVAEGFVNITNVHWYLSMYLVAVVMAKDAESLPEKTHDFLVLVISGLSGPFVVFIAPCLIIKRIYTRGGLINAIKGINLFDVVMAICCVIQLWAILTTSGSTRIDAPLGYSFGLLADIVSCRIIYGSFLPFSMAREMSAHGNVNAGLFIILCIGLIFAFFRYGWRVKCLILFPLLMIGFALKSPVIAIGQPQWPLIFNTESGERYFYVTNIALACLAIVLASSITKFRIAILSVGVIIFLAFVPKHFRLPALPESGYYQDVQSFDEKPSGETVSIRILPPGWDMKLIKK